MDSVGKAIRLKSELDALRPFKPGHERRIMDKFRLDWNYHSKNPEGNSLTYVETKALILFGTTAQRIRSLTIFPKVLELSGRFS